MPNCSMPKCSVGAPCSTADPYYLVVPTGGSWTSPEFLEVINRTVFVKSIVALDCADTSCANGGLASLIKSAALLQAGAVGLLSEALTKLVGCITSNHGVMSPVSCEPVIFASVIDTFTQAAIAVSETPVANPPFVPSLQTSGVATITGQTQLHVTRVAFLNSSDSWFETVTPDLFDPTHSSFAYNFVSYAGPFHKLWITVRLTVNPLFVLPGAILDPVDDCECEDEADGPCSGIDSMWTPL